MDLVTVGAAGGPVERWPGVRQWELPALGASLIERVLCFRGFLTSWLAAREFETIHFRSIFEGLPILKGHKGAALVFEVNGLPSIELKYRYPGSEDDRELMRKIEAQERACVAAADRIVTPSRVTREFLVGRRGAVEERVVVIPNGVDTESFRPRERPDGPWTLLYFGTLAAWQGVDVAVRAVARAGEVHFKLRGTGSRAQADAVRRLAEKLGVASRVAVGSSVSQQALADELAACHAVVAPLPWNDRNALQGCCPFKILEGMAAGRPVIASDLPVVREIGEHEEHLLLCKASSVDSLVEGIVRLRADPELARKLGTHGRGLVERRYTWETAVNALSGVYRECLAGAPALVRN